MSTIKTFDGATYHYQQPGLRAELARIVAGIRIYWQAMDAGLEAARRYKDLTARGVVHDKAVREVFDEHFGAR